MKCQIFFSGKTKKDIINVSSAEIAQRVVSFMLRSIENGTKHARCCL